MICSAARRCRQRSRWNVLRTCIKRSSWNVSCKRAMFPGLPFLPDEGHLAVRDGREPRGRSRRPVMRLRQQAATCDDREAEPYTSLAAMS